MRPPNTARTTLKCIRELGDLLVPALDLWDVKKEVLAGADVIIYRYADILGIEVKHMMFLLCRFEPKPKPLQNTTSSSHA